MEFTGERLVPGMTDHELEVEHLDRYRFACQFAAGKAVLDAACGTGYGSALLAEQAQSVVGVDISAEAIRYATEQYTSEKIEFCEASVTELPFQDNAFDLVVSFETLEHIDAYAQKLFMSEIRRVLKPTGLLVMSTPNHGVYATRGNNEFHVHELSYEEFRQLLEEQYPYVKLFSQKWEVCDAIVSETGERAVCINGLDIEQAEYMLAVCSLEPVEQAVPHLSVREDNRLKGLMDWAVENHERNEKCNQHIRVLDERIEESARQLRDQEENHARELARLQESHEVQLADQNNRHAACLMEQEAKYAAQLLDWEKEFAAQLASQRAEYTEQLKSQEKVYAERLAEQGADHAAQLLDREKEFAAQLASQRAEYAEQLKSQEKAYAERLAEQVAEYAGQLADREKMCADRLAAQEAEHAAQLMVQEKAYTDRLAAREAEHAARIVDQEKEFGERLREQEQRAAEQLQQLTTERQQSEGQNAQKMAELQQTLLNKEGHIALLLESDRELERIKASRSWRFMGYAWKVRDWIIPKGSKRRLLGKMLVKFVKHPIRFLGKCTPTRMGKFFKILNREGTESVSRRLDDCLLGNEIQKTELAVEHVEAFAAASLNTEAPAGMTPSYAVLQVPQWDEPDVSIVIPVYNQFDYTYLCVKSILEHSGDISYEILIADDCSTDMTTQIDDIIHGLRTIHNEENLRFLRNCNNAAKQARGKYILFLNNDTQVQENWLAPLMELIERNETIGMVGSKLVYPDGRLQEAGGILWKDGSAWNFGNRSDPDLPEFNYVKEVDYISGAAIMIRKTLWEEIGGFDERFVPAYCEDSDLAFEVRKHGYTVMYQPKSVVVHFEGVSNGTDTSSGQKAYQVINQQKFYEKWKDVLEREHNPNAENPFLARERGIGKKVLLMVDHYVPQFDKDAGSRTVYQYLQLFVDQGYHVKFIGDNFYPHQPYTEVLQQMGIEVLYGPYYAQHWKQWLKENGGSIQYAFLNRPHIAVNYIDEIRCHTPAKIVYYGHDLHFLREQREHELTGDEALVRSAQEWQKKELALMRKADMAYYPSYVEEEEIHRIAPDVNVKAIPAYLFREVEEYQFIPESRKNIMFIGGFGHKPNVDAVKWLAQEIIPILEKRLPKVVVHILGSNPPEEIKALATENLRIEGFVTDEELERYYRTCRMAIVPLRYGAGIKGKVVEAMRYGVPVVTTSVGSEGLANVSKILAIADSSRAFADRIVTLYNDKESLQLRSKKSVQYIRDNFSPNNAKEIIGTEFDME